MNKIRKVPNGSFLFSLDLKSLYTNIRHNIGIRLIKVALEHLCQGLQNPSKETLLSLLEAILTKNNFMFNNELNLQIAGTAMGTPKPLQVMQI